MSDYYDGYYDDVVPVDIDLKQVVSKGEIVKKAVWLIFGLIVFVSAAVACSMLLTA